MSSGKKPFRDRRQEERVRRDMTCMIRRFRYPGRLAQTIDLSANGIRFQHLGPNIEGDEQVLIQFTLNRETFTVFGQAVRGARLGTVAQDVALSFTGVDPATRSRLQGCLPPRA
jgi:hypothetical protein